MNSKKTNRRSAPSLLLVTIRIGALAVLVGLAAGLVFDLLPFYWFWLLLLLAALLPLLWPRQFGTWPGLLTVLAAAALPVLPLLLGWVDVDGSKAWYTAMMIWCFSLWLALPATLILLLWRQWASPPVLLWALAIAPVAVLLLLAFGAQPPDAALLTPARQVEYLVRMLPMWYVMLACTLAPLFFLVSLVWLVWREAAGAAHLSAQ